MSEKVEFEDILRKIYSDDDFEYDFSDPSVKLKECPLCHKLFYPTGRNSHLQSYCKRTHYIKCMICGKPVPQVPPSNKEGAVRPVCKGECSKLWRAAQTKRAMLDKYGYENASQVPELKERISEGLKAVSEETTRKVKATMQERYGGMGTASPILKAKIEATMQERYGVTNPDDLPEVRQKISEKLKSDDVAELKKSKSRARYGTDYPAQSEEVQQAMMKTAMERYGVPFVGMIPEVRAKAVATCIERYGVPCALQTEYAMEQSRKAFIEHRHNHNSKISKINQETASLLESDIGLEVDFEKMIHKKSYDLEIVGSNILVEVDPTYTHSTIPNHWTPEGKDPNYQLMKTEVAEEAGYRCIHIFDWDDMDKIAKMLQPKQTLYARKCKLEQIDEKTASEFVDLYHLQGKTRGAKYCYGLYHNGELVSVMTFGKPRYTSKYEWELLRLCTLPSLQIIGGPSRMFQHFIRNVNPKSILSYCDKAKFTGKVYTKLGMTLDHVSAPAKIWSKGSDYVTDNLLRQRGYDQLFNTNYGKGTSNDQLMLDNGWLPVYDCGQMVFTWHRD